MKKYLDLFLLYLDNRYFVFLEVLYEWSCSTKGAAQQWISAELFLIEGYVQGALRNELVIAPFVERLNSVNLGKSYWEILSVLRKIDLNGIPAEFLLIEG